MRSQFLRKPFFIAASGGILAVEKLCCFVNPGLRRCAPYPGLLSLDLTGLMRGNRLRRRFIFT